MMYLASAQMDTSYLKNAKTINNIARRKFAIYWTIGRDTQSYAGSSLVIDFNTY